MESLYLFCFALGVIYVVVMLIFGDILDLSFIDIPFLHSTTLLSFLVTFGGTGYYLENTYQYPWFVDIGISTLIGGLIFFLIFFLVALPLQRSEKNAAKSIQEVVGTYGIITVPCIENQLGEVVYTQNQIRFNAPAKSLSNEPLSIGTKVYISRIEDGVLFVYKNN